MRVYPIPGCLTDVNLSMHLIQGIEKGSMFKATSPIAPAPSRTVIHGGISKALQIDCIIIHRTSAINLFNVILGKVIQHFTYSFESRYT